MNSTELQEKSRKKSEYYHNLFPDIPTVSSDYLISLKQQGKFDPYDLTEESKVVLVDVRSKAERSVSVIPGSVSLNTFEHELVPILAPDTNIVTYCTVGYRSGLEARRLRNKYGLDDRIQHLDGILCYTHAASLHATKDFKENEKIMDQFDFTPKLIDPHSKEETKKVHVFGQTWNCVSDDFDPVHFSLPVQFYMTLRVGLKSILRTTQNWSFRFRRCLCQCFQ